MSSLIAQTAWRAKLDLGFSATTQRTILSKRKHSGPLLVQKPFYPEGQPCHIYLIHPPGGIVGGDLLQLDAHIESQAHALITTPAASKFYRSAGPVAHMQQTLDIAGHGCLEWLPQETIFFNNSQVRLTTRVNLAQHSRFIGWEILCLGRPASNELFTDGSIRQDFEIWQNQQPLFVERAQINGGDPLLHAPWGLRDYTVSATMICTPLTDDTQLYAALREISLADALYSISHFKYGMVARYLGHHAQQAREYFTQLWRIIRPQQLARAACEPRIWAT